MLGEALVNVQCTMLSPVYSRCTADKGLCSGLWLVACLATDFHPLLVAGELTVK